MVPSPGGGVTRARPHARRRHLRAGAEPREPADAGQAPLLPDGETTASGATKTRNFRWTHFDATIYELASAEGGRGWSTGVFRELFPELAARLKTYESRVATLKRIGYLTTDGRVTDAFTLHYRVHKGDHPELQRIRADLHARTFGKRPSPGSQSGGGRVAAGPGAGVLPGIGTAALPGAGAATSPGAETVALSGAGASSGRDTALWDTLHGNQRLLRRLERLGVSPAHLKGVHEEAQRRLPTPETLRQLRQALGQAAEVVASRPAVKRPGIIRAYCAVQRAKVVSIFEISKGLLTLRPGQHAALARRMLEQARKDYFFAKERRLAVVARRMRPIFFLGRIVAPGDVERLELALRRVGELPARETAEPFLRAYRRRLYRNSYDGLVAQLRAEERQAAREVDRRTIEPAVARGQGQESRPHDQRAVGPGVGGGKAHQSRHHEQPTVGPAAGGERPADDEAVARMRVGMEVLRRHRPGQFAVIASWVGREQELLECLVDRAKRRFKVPQSKEAEVGLLAYKIGRLLAKERDAVAVPVPPGFRGCERDVARANARMAAAGVDPPFPAARMQAVVVAGCSEGGGEDEGGGASGRRAGLGGEGGLRCCGRSPADDGDRRGAQAGGGDGEMSGRPGRKVKPHPVPLHQVERGPGSGFHSRLIASGTAPPVRGMGRRPRLAVSRKGQCDVGRVSAEGRCDVGCSSAETFGRITPNGKAVQWDESTLIALIREEVRRVMGEASRGGGPGGETMDVRELTALLGLNRKTVYSLIACGEIPGVRRLGRRIVVHRATVIRWLGNGQGSVPRSRR